MNSLSSHVLDTTLGRPAAGLKLELTCPDGSKVEGQTNSDGRCSDWQGISVTPGTYQLKFMTGEYLLEHHDSAFYPYVDIVFNVNTEAEHYHIPLLLSPFGFSSYRGS